MPWVSDPQTAWIDLLASKDWTRRPIPLKGTLSEASPWNYDDASGVLHCAAEKSGHEWYRFDREFSDFDLHLEFRFLPFEVPGKRYNSGIFVRNSRDGAVWHQAQIGGGDGGFFFGNTLVFGEPRFSKLESEMVGKNLVKPASEWNEIDIRADRGKLTLVVNGKVGSIMDCQVLSGYVGLEAEGFPIEFRNMKLRPLSGK
jgi:hypothetical protein